MKRTFVLMVLLTVGLWVAALCSCSATPESDTPGWKPAFSDDFERDLLGKDWRVIGGDWKIDAGWLKGQGEIVCPWRFPGPQRLEYDARSADPSAIGDHNVGDLSAFLAANEAGYKDGYFFGFGSNANSCSKMLSRGNQIANYDVLIKRLTTHHVVCEWDGQKLTHIIDGKVAHVETPPEGLGGDAHQMVGFYLFESGFIDNVKVFTKIGEAVAPGGRPISPSQQGQEELVANGSFELSAPGMRPRQPANWIVEPLIRQDVAELVSDLSHSHRGRRCMRLYSPGEQGIQVHNVHPRGCMLLTPGRSYDIRLWARSENQAEAELQVQPTGAKVKLADAWTRYDFIYHHPSEAPPEAGLSFAIRGGPAYVDDISVAASGSDEPIAPELRSNWKELISLPYDDSWYLIPDQPVWQERIKIVVRETAGEQAENYLAMIPLSELFLSYHYNFVVPGKIRVIEPTSEGARQVPYVIVSADDDPRVSALDRLVFPVSCPARSQRTYYVYLRDRQPTTSGFTPSSEVPERLAEGTYAYRLDIDIEETQEIASVTARMLEGRLEADLRGWTADSAQAELLYPDGQTTLAVPLKAVGSGRWTIADTFALPSGAPEGIWLLRANFNEKGGPSLRASAAFVRGNAFWQASNAMKIYRDDLPRHGRQYARIAAAANEWESFQAVLASENGLKGVTIRPTSLQARQGNGAIDPDSITVELVEEIPIFAALRCGPTPDVLIPWDEKEKADIQAAKQIVAWVTVKVPADTAAGIYTGELIASSADGLQVQMPIELEVFGFSLPKVRSFVPVLGVSTIQNHLPDEVPIKQARPDTIRMFGERHITPFYYQQEYTSPYAVFWSYDKATGTVRMDFTMMDETLELIRQFDIKYLFFGGEYRPRLPSGNGLYYVTGPGRPDEYGWHGTELGRKMTVAWLKGLREHRPKEGWPAQPVIYINDESWGMDNRTSDGRLVRDIIREYAELIRKTAPEFKTLIADNAGGNWQPLLELTDHFTGPISQANGQRFTAQGGVVWGLYNRPITLDNPLAVGRIVGLDSYFRGWSHYFHWAVTEWGQTPWASPRMYLRSRGKNRFVIQTFHDNGYSRLIYPWPCWRRPWQPGLPTLCPSIRLEALRESAEDYEYLKLLSEALKRLDQASPYGQRGRILMNRVHNFLSRANLGDDHKYGGGWSNFLFDADEFDDLRRQMGSLISEISNQAIP